MSTVARVAATLDGREVPASGMRWSSEAGGYHRASIRIPESAARRLEIGQGSILKLWQQNGRPAWEGRLARPPYVRRGEALLEANGYKVAAEKAHDRLMYQVRDLSVWGDATLPPHSYAVPTDMVAISTAPQNGLVIEMTNRSGAAKTFRALIAAWFPGAKISRYAFGVQGSGTGTLTIQVDRATGPNGTRTTIATHATGVDQVVTDGEDMLVIQIAGEVPNATDTATLKLYDLRVNDAGTTTDSLFTSELVTDIARRLGWDARGILPTSTDVMPLDLISGSWADAGLDYAAELDARQWRVLDDRGSGPFLEYVPWGHREWRVLQQDGAKVGDLQPLEAFNRVIVRYTDNTSAPRQVVRDAFPDPLNGRYTNAFEYQIPGTQADEVLAQLVADTLLPEVTRERWSGPVHVTKVYDQGTPHDIVAGDVLTIMDWDQGEAKRLRVASTDGDPTGQGISLETGSARAASLVARTGLGRSPLSGLGPMIVHRGYGSHRLRHIGKWRLGY